MPSFRASYLIPGKDGTDAAENTLIAGRESERRCGDGAIDIEHKI